MTSERKTPFSYGPAPALSTSGYDVLVLGAGAAGLMCALSAARRGLAVLLADKAPRPGGKIRISGGGKANFTNRDVTPQHYVTPEPSFCAPALALCPPESMLRYVERHHIPWEERDHGRIFCRVSAQRLEGALIKDCTDAGCAWLLEQNIQEMETAADGFLLRATSSKVQTRQLVIATGSPAWPQLGATDYGMRLARSLGHSIVPVRPLLAPLRMPPDWPLGDLSGISLPVRLQVNGCAFEDDLLFTHHGISGPAVLLASCRWSAGAPLEIDFLPSMRFDELLDVPECGKMLPRSLLSRHLPQRLADRLLPEALARRKIAELSRAQRTQLRDAVHAHSVIPKGMAGLDKAEAAAGGVATKDVDSHSMRSRVCPNLFFAGEVLDVTGYLGGYNLHWAWASGMLAGNSVGE